MDGRGGGGQTLEGNRGRRKSGWRRGRGYILA